MADRQLIALYRAVQKLSWGGRTVLRGTVFRATALPAASVARLVATGGIAPVSTPPLALVPGWRTRAARLAKEGIDSVEGVLGTGAVALAACFRVRVPTAERWLRELEEYFVSPVGEPNPRG